MKACLDIATPLRGTAGEQVSGSFRVAINIGVKRHDPFVEFTLKGREVGEAPIRIPERRRRGVALRICLLKLLERDTAFEMHMGLGFRQGAQPGRQPRVDRVVTTFERAVHQRP